MDIYTKELKDSLNKGRFYTQFADESLEEAILCHSQGFSSIQDAIDEANVSEVRWTPYKVYNDQLEIVYEGIAIPNPINKEMTK